MLLIDYILFTKSLTNSFHLFSVINYRLHKSTALVKKSPTTPSPAAGLRSDDKAAKRKEVCPTIVPYLNMQIWFLTTVFFASKQFLKKLGEKSIARESEKSQLAAKSKVRVVCL